jgi:histone H1/5
MAMATAKKAVEPAKKVVAAPAKVEKKVVKAAPMKAGCGRCAPKAAEKAAPVAKKTVKVAAKPVVKKTVAKADKPVAKKTVAAAKPVAKKAAAPKAAKPVAKKPVAKKAAPKK